MLRVARAHVISSGVDFRLSNGVEIPVPDASADAVFSSHVFQHFSTLELARQNFSEVSRILRPSGTAMIHLPIYEFPQGFAGLESFVRLRHFLTGLRDDLSRRRGTKIMRGLSFSRSWLHTELVPLGFKNIETVTFLTNSNNSVHPFVFLQR